MYICGDHSATRKKETPTIPATWMDLEDIMVSVSGKTTIVYHLYLESEKAKLLETESRRNGGSRGLGNGGSERCWSKGTNFIRKGISSGNIMHGRHGDYS